MPRQVLLVLEGLSPTFTSEQLKQLCQPYGNVLFAKVLLAGSEPADERLGFVRMETVEQAEQLVDHIHGRQIDARMVRVTLLPEQTS
jgi:RNA recognition motif. (a.k.a. RRM, RBD, or RNP domain)